MIVITSIYLLLMLSKITADHINTGGPTVVKEGGDALLTCVITDSFGNDTILWRKGPSEILSAGLNRVTSDKRISVLHDEVPSKKPSNGGSGDVWVLLIKSVKLSDTDVYVCEVNSDPVLRSFHTLQIKRSKPTPSAADTQTLTDLSPPNSESESEYQNFPRTATHDYTDCCESFNVSSKCLSFCTIHNILEGTTEVEPEACENDFPNIIKCMVDGRNHLPCCERKRIPDLCTDICRGDYTPFTDYLKSRISCASYTIPALECILEGVQTLPSAPRDVFAEPNDERSLKISWAAPENLANSIKNYRINVTMLTSFDQDFLANNTATTISISIPPEMNTTIISNLSPNTMYTVFVIAENEFGSSLPSFRKRVITLEGGKKDAANDKSVIPKLPDIKSCCVAQGLTHRTCLDKMCDPVKADLLTVPDLMICAPWSNFTFSCLANGIDHTSCCKHRGLPDMCLSFCDGTVKTLNFSLFKCLQYMSDYSSCLLQGYGVLPGRPTHFKSSLVSSQYAILEWKAPTLLNDTITTYHLSIRKLGTEDDYMVTEKKSSPIVLENLEPDTNYEVFVVAVNYHGKSNPSSRLIFRTKSVIEVEQLISSSNYNMTTCCKNSGFLPQCMALCTYDIKMSDLQTLGSICVSSIANVVRCAAGGRDHTPCCERRGVSKSCLANCKGVLVKPNECVAFAGNIIQCFEEGTGNIPGPVENFHATSVSNNSISLSWTPFENDTKSVGFKDFLVQYGEVDNMTVYETVIKLDNERPTTDSDVDLDGLKPNTLYRIMVISRGDFGNSLPSSMLLINTSISNRNALVYGSPSPPHSLVVSAHGATFVSVSWQPPEFSLPHEKIMYRVFHRNGNNVTIIDTKMLWTRFNRLKPNSQHILYLIAIGSMGTSMPSETLVTWTDPAIPAFLDPPSIHPSDFVSEGSSLTILCVALGNPMPTVKLYVGGHFVREEMTRHMATTIHNVSTDMADVTCYADNGYGIPMQTTRKININFAPRIQTVNGIQIASAGDLVELKCTIKSKPIPKIMFWKDHEGRIPVIKSANIDIQMLNNPKDPTKYTMVLKIVKLGSENEGEYFCHAENALGSDTRPVSVRIRNTAATTNITECCFVEKVSPSCMSACSFYVDIESVIDRPECLKDFDKLMKCASDGSDHRTCCAQKDVPRKCLNWCRGEEVTDSAVCALQYTKPIIGCFQENYQRLPGPPMNVVFENVLDNQVLIKWDPPMKNPDTVEGYRIFWHNIGNRSDNSTNIFTDLGTSRIDAKERRIQIPGLERNVEYELVVKAGNHYGASVLSTPLRFTLDSQIASSQSLGSGRFFGGIVAGLGAIVALTLLVAVYFFRSKSAKNKSVDGGVAFENPSYMKELSAEHVRISTVQQQSSNNLSAPSSATQSNNIPTATEVNPTFYEEHVKLGNEKGFKKLVS